MSTEENFKLSHYPVFGRGPAWLRLIPARPNRFPSCCPAVQHCRSTLPFSAWRGAFAAV